MQKTVNNPKLMHTQPQTLVYNIWYTHHLVYQIWYTERIGVNLSFDEFHYMVWSKTSVKKLCWSENQKECKTLFRKLKDQRIL